MHENTLVLDKETGSVTAVSKERGVENPTQNPEDYAALSNLPVTCPCGFMIWIALSSGLHSHSWSFVVTQYKPYYPKPDSKTENY